jgi:hypothetical protein
MDHMSRRPLPGDDMDIVLHEAGGVWEELRGKRLFIT